MRARIVRLCIALAAVAALIFGMAAHASALDDTYTFDDIGMSVKFPKSNYVITRDTPRGDDVFAAVELDYDETMTAFRAADIYLRAYEPEGLYQISLIVTKDDNSAAVNNYSDLTAAQRKSIVDAILSDESVSSAVEVKHNGIIFFDSSRQSEIDGEPVYINQCNTVVNGMQIDLTMQKSSEEISVEEAKALTNAVNSVSFEDIRRNTGPVFDWWRLALWAGILLSLSVSVSFIYRHHNSSKKRQLEERRRRRTAHNSSEDGEGTHAEPRQQTFEESLGYRDDEEFTARADADEMAGYDISVKEKDPAKGIAYFEDGGDSIDDGSDYFDTYFNEPTEKRPFFSRLAGTVSAYFTIALNHTGYFFKNLFNRIFHRDK